MADLADQAFLIEQEHIARGLAAVCSTIPDGEPGECDECGEVTPRIVDGLCAPCREPRIPRRY